MAALLRRSGLAAACVALLASVGPQARAQFYCYAAPDSYGHLRGTADLVNAQANFVLAYQQAQLFNEQVRQMRIETRRRQLEAWLYAREITPTREDERERSRREEVRRAQNDPPLTEVLAAKALNDLLVDLQRLQARGVEGPAVPLDQQLLAKINVTAGNGGNTGLPKQENLHWPLLFARSEFRSEREQIDSLMQQAARQATSGQMDAGTIEQIRGVVRSLEGQVKKLARAGWSEKTTDMDLIGAKRFLGEVHDAVNALQNPDVGQHLNGAYAAKGRTVAELLAHLSSQGLRFAPAVNGNEAAYRALHRALASYSLGMHQRAGNDPDAARVTSFR